MENITVIGLGDIFLGGDLDEEFIRNNSFDPFSVIEKYTSESDIRIGNIEFSYFRGPLRTYRGTHLYSNQVSINSLKKLGVDVGCLANNHVMDFGTKSMLRTKKILKENGISVTGIGINSKDAMKPVIKEIKGKRIGILAFTDEKLNVNSVLASSFSSGCAPMYASSSIKIIKELRKKVDLLLVYLHWGYEFFNFPHEKQRKFARYLIDNGVDTIFGSHPHIIQGYEMMNGRPVFYSMGNLVFPEFNKLNGEKYTWKRENNYSLIPKLNYSFNQSDINVSLEVKISCFTFPNVHFLEGMELVKMQEHLSFLNKNIDSNIDESKYKKLLKRHRKLKLKTPFIRFFKSLLRTIIPWNYLDYFKYRKLIDEY